MRYYSRMKNCTRLSKKATTRYYSMEIFFGSAASDLGMRTSSMPLSNLAWISSCLTFRGRPIERVNEPKRRSWMCVLPSSHSLSWLDSPEITSALSRRSMLMSFLSTPFQQKFIYLSACVVILNNDCRDMLRIAYRNLGVHHVLLLRLVNVDGWRPALGTSTAHIATVGAEVTKEVAEDARHLRLPSVVVKGVPGSQRHVFVGSVEADVESFGLFFFFPGLLGCVLRYLLGCVLRD
jgi:hypothetical protein